MSSSRLDDITGTDRPLRSAATRSAAVIVRICDTVLDTVVVVLATWTVVYHVSLLLHLTVSWALGLELVALVGAAALRRALFHAALDDPAQPIVAWETSHASRRPHVGTVVTLAAASLAAVGMAAHLPWPSVWVSWLVAAVAGTWTAIRRLMRSDASPAMGIASPRPTLRGVLVVLGWAVGLSALSTFTLRPNPDDLYYVNLSQWVAEHGTFPIRDTLFSDLVYPMANWPPMASYDALTGSVAHLMGTQAGSVVYVIVPPLATFVSVLALWRLLRAWRLRSVTVALSAALVFLLFDGTSAYGPPGNLFLTRLWQGKVILLCLLVPLLLVYALRYAERPSLRGALWLFLGGAASVGLSTTAMFLTPLIAAAGAAPLVPRSRRHALLGFAAMAAYPMAAGVVTLALGGRSADDFGIRRLYRFDADWFGHAIFLSGLLAVIAVFAVLVGCLLLPHPAAGVTTALLVLITGITFIPGVTRVAYAATGLGPTLWRVSWGCTIAALVGVTAAWVAERLRRRSARWVSATFVAGLLAVFGAPIWAPETSTSLVAPIHWQRDDTTRPVVAWIIENSRPGDLVLAPYPLAITIAVTTTDIKTVAPRDYFMDYLRNVPSFRYRERITLVDFANDVGEWRLRAVTSALHDLGVEVACVHADDASQATALEAAGFRPGLTTASYQCLRA